MPAYWTGTCPLYFPESRFNGFVGFFQQHFLVLWTFPDGVNRLVDGQLHAVPVQQLAGTRQDVERAVYGHRHDGKLQLVGHLESSFLELPHVAAEGTGSFREYHHRGTSLQDTFRVLDGFVYFAWAGLVHKDESGHFAGFSHERNFPQTLLHHPFEVSSQIPVYQKDVEGSLVIGQKDVRGLFVDVFFAFYLDGQQERDAGQL